MNSSNQDLNKQETQTQDLSEIFHSALDALGERLAILDAHGWVLWVNHAWRRFAARSDAPVIAAAEPGVNYLDVCREAATEHQSAHDTLYGIYSVLEGLVERFALDYSFGEPPNTWGWYLMTVRPLRGGAGGLIISHRESTTQKLAEQERDRLNLDLQLAMSSLHTLSTLLPVCGACGRLRQDPDYFKQVQAYFQQHPDIGSFGVCPECHGQLFNVAPAAAPRCAAPRFVAG